MHWLEAKISLHIRLKQMFPHVSLSRPNGHQMAHRGNIQAVAARHSAIWAEISVHRRQPQPIVTFKNAFLLLFSLKMNYQNQCVIRCTVCIQTRRDPDGRGSQEGAACRSPELCPADNAANPLSTLRYTAQQAHKARARTTG